MSREVLLARAPKGLVLSPELLAVLESAYETPPRAYHSLQHVVEVAKWHQRVHREVGFEAPHETYLAVLFHDAVYVAGASDNEAKSAVLARESMKGLTADAGRVASLIELTARHGSLRPEQVDGDAAHFLDCDMAILGASADDFVAYDRAIRTEYAHVPDDAYREGRRAFFDKLLASPRIYLSTYFHERLDLRARENIVKARASE